MKYRINEPYLKGNEKKYLSDVIDSEWLSPGGKYSQQFEEDFAKYVESRFAFGVQSGTAALHTALMAMGVKKNDYVIVPNFTCGGCVTSVLSCNAIPLIADIELDTLGLKESEIRKMIQKYNPSALMLVHIYGYPARDTIAIKEICEDYSVKVLEDCAEAHSAKIDTRMVGSFGDLATYSIRADKMIGVGEGGVITTNNESLFKNIKYFASRASPFRNVEDSIFFAFFYTDVGMNYRLPEVLASIGVAQLEQAKTIKKKKQEIAKTYRDLIENIEGIKMQIEIEKHENVNWLNAIMFEKLNFSEMKELAQYLISKKIEVRPGFYPLSFQGFPAINYGSQVNGIYAFKHMLILPSSVNLKEEDIKFIVETLKKKI